MQDSQSSNPTVAKLLEVDADLAAQEVELTSQLQSIQEKRHSLKTVINLFGSNATAYPPIAVPVVEEQIESIVQEAATPELKEAKIAPPDEATEAPSPQKQQTKKNTSPASSKQNKKSPLTKAVVKEADNWQQYLREEFADASLSVAVAEVMQQQPKQVLEITAILDTIFVDEISKEVRSTARERISNVLSVGAKKGKWYRGQAGKYSMSKAAVEDNSAV